ncbi:YibE/F family protein [Bombilactobacillus folatiphilus]|uniref:YibE/F family protein n=1 Tax=Bombilactobacillus folatiphilus TaxID=2923362 RepID=A0ABY4P996_9LACO|nr:YibE/F family protein [Bombilactobacillus folatiphilus]UQS82096.1 YibE/F family protein [Bombilactobacillus folatiphilus]
MKSKLITLWLVIAFFAAGMVGLWFQSFQGQLVVRVQQVTTVHQEAVKSSNLNHDQRVKQRLKVKQLNGRQRGQTRILFNTYVQSQANTNRYYPGTKLLVHSNKKMHHLSIIGPKRDSTLIVAVFLVLLVLWVLLRQYGLRVILSAIFNLGCFVGALLLMTKWQNQHIWGVTTGLTLIVTVSTLLLVFGYSWQTLIAILATLISTFGAVGFSVLVLKFSHNQGIHFETLDHGIQPFETVFLAETLLGVLGAVMDETSDITASMYQLLQEKNELSSKQLLHSGLTVGQEIIGPLINVLFYIFLAELIPLLVLYLRNGNTLAFSMSRTMTLGYTQTIISALGIVVAVPITAFLAAHLLKKVKQ